MGAIDYVPHGRLAIGSGSTLRVDDGKGMLLYVWQGSVWLTQESDRRDHLVKSGESFRIDRTGTILISSLGQGAVISLTSPPVREQANLMKAIRLLPAALLAGCVSAASVPENLKPASGESLKRIVAAKGVQIYECREGRWLFVAPEAELFDQRGNLIGKHYAGPHWEATGDGSKVVGKLKSRADAPVAGAIPWLLLSTKSVGGQGYFADVTSIQRVATHGGVAPAGDCAKTGMQARVPYTADYHFFAQ
jgi:hypothetical protein